MYKTSPLTTPLSKNQLKTLAAFKLQKNCDEHNLFVVEGVKMCHEALLSGFTIRTVCATDSWWSTLQLGLPPACSCYSVDNAQLERLSALRTPNKVWMLLQRDVPPAASASDSVVLALDGLQDPGNMGTILRTADWYGIRNVICSHDTVSCYNPKVVQATMGAIFRTHVDYCDLADRLQQAAASGTATYGAMLDGEPYHVASLQHPAILVVGNEGRGLSPAVADAVRHRLTIPNVGGTCESLNAAVATGILLARFFTR